MQSAKGEGLAGTSFSGGVSGAVFGGRGAASFLSRATTILAVLFMFNCGALAFMSSQSSGVADTGQEAESVVTRQAQAEQERYLQQQQQQQQQADQSDSLFQVIQSDPNATGNDTTGN
jgi:protein translocase SecG subunit